MVGVVVVVDLVDTGLEFRALLSGWVAKGGDSRYGFVS